MQHLLRPVFFYCLALLWLGFHPLGAAESLYIVQGAGGQEEFTKDFQSQTVAWKTAGAAAGALTHVFAPAEEKASKTEKSLKEALAAQLAAEPKKGPEALWIVLLGHGTWDGKKMLFNLPGPDFSDEELAAWLKDQERPVVLFAAFSSSAPVLKKLAGPQRLLISATRSGSEQNRSYFGKFLAQSLTNAKTDQDGDGAASVLELFLGAARLTAEHYKSGNLLATEHPLLDDNGDGLGTPAEWFVGLRATQQPNTNTPVDGAAALVRYLQPPAAEKLWNEAQRAQRELLEKQLADLRDLRAKLTEEEYLKRIEPLLRELAELTQRVEGRE